MFEFLVATKFNFNDEEFIRLQEISSVTAFQHSAWQNAMQNYTNNINNAKPVHLVVRRKSDQKLVLTLFLVRRHIGPFSILEYANFGLVDYACAVIDEEIWPDLVNLPDLVQKVKNCLPSHDILRLKHIRKADLKLTALFNHANIENAGFSAHATHLGNDFTAWRQKYLSSNRRSHINRHRNKMKKQGTLELSTVTAPEDIDHAFEFLKATRFERFNDAKDRDYLQDEAGFNFYVNLAKDSTLHGYTDTTLLTCGGKTVACVFGLIDKGCYYYILPGADYETFGQFSPGQVMIDDLIREMMSRGITDFDFSIGDEGYKATFGTKATPIHTIIQANSLPGRFGLFALRCVLRLRKMREKSSH